MTTDITELAQSLKAAAEKATQGQWIVESQDCRWNVTDAEGVQVALAQQRTATRDDPKQADRTANAEFIAMANPANILDLVEALEKAQAENTAGVAGMAESYETIISMLRSRIAELESRTVTAPSPQPPRSEPATVPGKWIPVSERLPEVGEIVLAAMGGAVIVSETECTATGLRFFTSVISGRELPATHWMPLPADPQEVNHG